MKKLFLFLLIVLLIAAGVALYTTDVAAPTEEEIMEDEMDMDDEIMDENNPDTETVILNPEAEDTCLGESEVCEVSNDCCRNLSLECTSVTLTSGTTEKRCMPFTKTICTIGCSEDGVWGRAEFCKTETVPSSDTPDCATLTGTCDPSVNTDRNGRKCWKS